MNTDGHGWGGKEQPDFAEMRRGCEAGEICFLCDKMRF